MATLVAARAAASKPVFKPLGSGLMSVAWGSYTLAVNPTAADIVQFCRVPPNSIVLGGWLRGQDIDTGTGVFDFDMGWAANGAEAADPDGFGNFGALNGTAVANYLPEGGFLLPFHGVLGAGPVSFSRETIIQGVVNVQPNAGGTGVLTAVVLYTVA
jgi:hypothetical protein